MFKKFTRGGQVTMHNVNMVRQVLTVTFLLTLMVGVGGFLLKSWYDFSPFERSAAMAYYWADFKTDFPLVKKEQKKKLTQHYTHEDGRRQLVYSLDIVNDPWHQKLAEGVNDQLISNAISCLWGMLVFFIIACSVWAWRGARIKDKKVLSGTEIAEPTELNTIMKKQNIISSFKLGGVNLRLNCESQHLLFCGTTGTGKSTCFTQLMPQIREKNQRAIVIDTTGEFVNRFYRKDRDILINPFDARSVGWNPWIEAHSPYHYDEIACGFIPQTGHDRFWAESARTVFSEAMMYLNKDGSRNVEVLMELLLSSSLKDLYETLKHTPAANLLDPAGDKTAMSIRSHLTPYLKVLRYLPKDKPAFSVRQWVLDAEHKNDDDSWIFIVSTPDQRETLKPLLTGLMTIAFNSLMNTSPDPDRRLWFIIDELISLHKQEVLPKALAEVRKYGGCIIAGIQNIPQLQELYGHSESKSLSSLFNTKVIFRNSDPETARYMSQMLGEQEVIEAMEGLSYGQHAYRDSVSLNDQRRMKPVVSATDIMALNDLEAYLKLPGNLPVTRLKFGINRLQKICPSFVPVSSIEKIRKYVLNDTNCRY